MAYKSVEGQTVIGIAGVGWPEQKHLGAWGFDEREAAVQLGGVALRQGAFEHGDNR